MLVLCVVSCSCVCLAGGVSVYSSVFTGTYARSSAGQEVSSLPPLSAMRNGHQRLAGVGVCVGVSGGGLPPVHLSGLVTTGNTHEG